MEWLALKQQYTMQISFQLFTATIGGKQLYVELSR